MGENEWYDNKAIYEMLQDVKTKMAELSKQMAETQTMLRDYNSLREKVEATAGAVRALQWLMPIAIASVSLIFTLLNYLN